MSIPKIIFQSSLKKPEQYVIDKILLNCQDYKYIHYTDSQAIQFFTDNYIEEFKDIINKFNEMPTGAHKVDLFRYYHLYITGGVYIDSDAMICDNIENIIKNYDFVSIYSIIPGTLFNGFIVCTPNHIAIYQALCNAYTINIQHLRLYYHLLCRNLYLIVHNNKNDRIHLYNEKVINSDNVETVDDENKTILIHYWKNKTIPQ